MNPDIPLDWFSCPVSRKPLTFSGDTAVGAETYRRNAAHGYWDFVPAAARNVHGDTYAMWEQLQENGEVSYREDPEHNLGVGARADHLAFADFCGFHGNVLDVGVGPQKEPTHLQRARDKSAFFVGIDSDGCAFDAMDIKHQECFTPTTIKHWHLQAASTLARETAIFVNLGSTTRGQNRWIALARVFELLAQRPEVAARGVTVPTGDELNAFITSGYPLSDKGIEDYAAAHPGPEIERCIEWGKAVNAAIADMVHGCPPFPGVREAFEAMQAEVDCMTVSATPMEALVREWHEHGLAPYMKVIAGQEMGTKAQHIEYAAKGKYADDHILLIGDAPGDRDSAESTGVLYYPINPCLLYTSDAADE
mgnify:CR=1 FL=1